MASSGTNGHPDLDEEALADLPIFPLPDVVLLPGALLPLHVFEPRYRDMTRDVLSGNELMAVARLEPGYEADYHGRPPVHDVCGVGRVIASDELADGRYNILLRGLHRIRIERELPAEHSYRRVCARKLPDVRCQRPDELAPAHAQLVALCDRLSLSLESGGEQLRQLVRGAKHPGPCADQVAAALIADADRRQRLLETRDPCDRLAMTLDHVAELVVELDTPPSSVPN